MHVCFLKEFPQLIEAYKEGNQRQNNFKKDKKIALSHVFLEL